MHAVIDHFVNMTRRIIVQDGLDEYLPTLLMPARRDVRVLEGIPQAVDVEAVSVEWAERTASPTEDFLLAFRSGQAGFKVVARINGERHESLHDV